MKLLGKKIMLKLILHKYMNFYPKKTKTSSTDNRNWWHFEPTFRI